MLKKSLIWTSVGLGLMVMVGCDSSREADTPTDTTISSGLVLTSDPATGVAYVGSDTCITCHQDFSWSSSAVDKFLAGKHVIHSDHITQADAIGIEKCGICHDPIGDGPRLEAFIDAEYVPADGLAAVGCENCHGAGGDHFGIGPMPNATPDFEACGECHNADMFHNAYHPEGDNIVEDYRTSPHAASGDRPDAVCNRCHTDEGGRLYRAVNSVAGLETIVQPVENASPIQCRTCHDPHARHPRG